jgi:hypothetical protein
MAASVVDSLILLPKREEIKVGRNAPARTPPLAPWGEGGGRG